MKVKTQDYNDVTVVELQGDFDGEFSETFQRNIMEVVSTHKVGIVLDMSNVGFIEGQGLEQLLWARDYCSENKCQLRLAGLDENCLKILEITLLESEFVHCAELTEAVKNSV